MLRHPDPQTPQTHDEAHLSSLSSMLSNHPGLAEIFAPDGVSGSDIM